MTRRVPFLPTPFLRAASLLTALAPLGASAQGGKEVERQITVFGGYNDTAIPRSEDPRRGAGIGYRYTQREPRLTRGAFRGRLLFEGYYLGSTSPGPYEFNPDRTDAIGAFAALRWQQSGRWAVFGDVGFGVQYSSQASHDIPLQLNTTPTAMVGVRYVALRGNSVEFGVRYLHVSNGGRKEPNGGQNWLLATLAFSF